MTKRLRLTDSVVNSLPLSASADRRFYYDQALPGLQLQITRYAKSWYIYKNWKGRPIRHKFGEFPVMGVSEARSVAIGVLSDLAKGATPSEKKRKVANAVHTYDQLFQKYYTNHLVPHTSSYAEAMRGHNMYCKSLKNRQLAEITRDDIQTWLIRIGSEHGEATANRTFNTVRACIRWGRKKNLFTPTIDPTEFIDLYDKKSDERYLTEDEWVRLKKVLDENPGLHRDIILLLAYTAARKSNVLSMEWREIHIKTRIWIVPASKSKNGRKLIIPLTDSAIEILLRRQIETQITGKVFPSERSQSGHFENIDEPWREKIRKQAGLDDLKIHHLRHNAASWMGISGANAFEIQRQLGHASVTTTMKYVELHSDGVRSSFEKAQMRFRSHEKRA